MSSRSSVRIRLRRSAWLAQLALSAPGEIRFPYGSRLAVEEAAGRRFRDALAHAARHVPHYRDALRRMGADPRELRGVDDIRSLPLISREELHDEPARFLSDAIPRRNLIAARTSGASGTPIEVHQDLHSTFVAARLGIRYWPVPRHFTGGVRRPRALAFVNPGAGGSARKEAFRGGALIRAIAPSATRVSMYDTVERNVERINSERPEVVSGFGSYLEAIYEHLDETGSSMHSPALVRFGGDGFSARGRRLIEERFGIPVRGVYASIEAPSIGFECELGGGYHVNADMFPVRIVGPDGSDCPVGVPGELVVSNLISRGTMLINYKLGDRASLLDRGCACGRTLPLLSMIEGRAYDWLERLDGGRLHPEALKAMFRGEPAVRRFQIRQRERDLIEVAVVPSSGDLGGLEERLTSRFSERLGGPVHVTIVRVDDLPRTSSGKVKTVVRDC